MYNAGNFADLVLLVPEEFNINYEGPSFVQIAARKGGFRASLNVYDDRVEVTRGTCDDQSRTILPLAAVSSVNCGFSRPQWWFLVGMVCGVIALFFLLAALANQSDARVAFSIFAVFLAAGCGLCLWNYYNGKRILLQIISNSGHGVGICLKQTSVEGVVVDYAMAQEVSRIVSELVMRKLNR